MSVDLGTDLQLSNPYSTAVQVVGKLLGLGGSTRFVYRSPLPGEAQQGEAQRGILSHTPIYSTPGFVGPIQQAGGAPVAEVKPVPPPPVQRGGISQLPTEMPPLKTPVGGALGESTMSLDLGQLISQGIAAYQAVNVAEAASNLPVATVPATSSGGAASPTTVPTLSTMPTPSGTNYPGLHQRKVCYEAVLDGAGNVIAWREIKRRHRRRRLLTKSDIVDIAKLKGVVGTGKTFNELLALLGPSR